jgi:cytochrome c biogenesis protein CcmG/thiol:disulfide interchange protein DsbE
LNQPAVQTHHGVESAFDEAMNGRMKRLTLVNARLPALICLVALAARADEFLPVLKANGEVYSNVTVTKVTITDIYFINANGVGNAKLKNLPPGLQEHFHYNAARNALVEKQQATNNAEYHQYVLSVKPPPASGEEPPAPASGDDDFVAPNLYARSVRGQVPPAFAVERWLTPQPEITGKFVLIEFWATSSEPCRLTIPQLNAFYEKYHDRLVIVCITDESETAVRRMTGTRIKYAVAIDTQARMMKALEITRIPHCILLDPQHIVRYEGMPGFLDEQKLDLLFEKYK